MTGPIDPSGLGRTLADVVAALGRAQTPTESPVGTGEAAEGRIRVRAVLPGRIENLEVDPSLLRAGVEELAREIESAVNAALADLQDQALAAARPADLGALAGQLKDIQFDAERQFAKLTASLVEAQERLTRRASER